MASAATGEFIAGGLGGVACVLTGQPFDTVKVKLQTFPHLYKSVTQCVKHTYRQEGFLGFYAGSSPAYVTNLIENAVLFLVYEHCVSLIQWMTGQNNSTKLSLVHHAGAGGIASVAAVMAYSPADRIKSLMQVQGELITKKSTSYRTLSQVQLIRTIIKEEGLSGLYRGTTGLLLRDVPGYLIFFVSYGACNKILAGPGEDREDMALWKVGLSGGVAGCGLWATVYPIDVIKARIQVDKEISGAFWKNTKAIMSKEIKSKGIRSVYRGLSPTLIRSFPANGALFITYEYVRRSFNSLLLPFQ